MEPRRLALGKRDARALRGDAGSEENSACRNIYTMGVDRRPMEMRYDASERGRDEVREGTCHAHRVCARGQ